LCLGGTDECSAGAGGHLGEVAGGDAEHVDRAVWRSSIAAASTPVATNFLP
jgi:hypothetical protein